MRKLPARGLLLFVALVLALLAALAGLLSLPWVKPRPVAPPHVETIVRGGGPLLAGVGVAPIELPLGAPIGGFAHLSYRSTGADPVSARAVVVSSGGCRVALASAEVLLIPDSLRAAVMARLSDLDLSGLILSATHTHASPGGYYENLAFERIALGPYDPLLRDRVANAVAQAVRRAAEDARPARLSVAHGRATGLVRGRNHVPPYDVITVLRLDRPSGEPVAELTLFAAHATVLGRHNRRISGDWPARFYSRGLHGVRLLLPGALGDQTIAFPMEWGPLTAESYGAALDRAVTALDFGPPDAAPALAYAAAELTLPTPAPEAVPRPLRQAATNVASAVLPTQSRVSALRLGPVLLLAAPGEPVAALGERWRAMAGPGAEVVSLADGYVGYVETAEHVEGRVGEYERTYYGPALAAVVERGLVRVVGAVREAEAPARKR